MNAPTIKRLNWGCGSWTPEGWINSDIKDDPGVDLPCNILEGLPLETDSIDYAVSIHALPEMTYPNLVPVLQELRRVLKPGGVLRLSLPDIDRGIAAYQRGDLSYFLVPDEDARSIGAKFITQMLWYGYSKLLFTHDFIEEMLMKAGFSRVDRCAFKQTKTPWPEILDLDNRESESLFVEAVK
jgi:predicted SAM-dependent methyltransferase